MKNSKRNLLIAALLLLPFSFIWYLNQGGMASQQSTTETTSTLYPNIDQPISNVDVPVNVFTVHPDKDQEFTTWRGSKVRIPANCFVDQQGNPIQDSVQIIFKEYHHAADIICSGIPMQNEGSEAIMETAGMFQISGSYNGQDIAFQEGKEIVVDLVSFNDGKDFNFFEMEKNNCHWTDLGGNEPIDNEDKKVALQQLDQQMNSELPFENKQKLSGDQYFDFQLDYSSYPELAPFKNIVWTMRGGNTRVDDLFQVEWDSMSLNQTEDGFYNLALYHKDETELMAIQPVLEGNDYELALQQFNAQTQKEQTGIRRKLDEKRQRVKSMANIRRLATINQMGIYNYDIWKNLDFDKCESEILVDSKVVDDDELKDTRFYLMDKDQKYIISFDLKTLKNNFVYDPLKKNTVIAIFKDGNAAFID